MSRRPHALAGHPARRGRTPSFIAMDDPEHARLRRTVTGVFTIRRIEQMRPGIQHLVDGLIDEMLAGPPRPTLPRHSPCPCLLS